MGGKEVLPLESHEGEVVDNPQEGGHPHRQVVDTFDNGTATEVDEEGVVEVGLTAHVLDSEVACVAGDARY